MSPDIEWHIGQETEGETISHTGVTRRSRRSWIAMLIAVAVGATLGLAYRSIPEPAPRPTPAPSPTPHPTSTLPAVPAKLFAAIDREAQALADGDFESYLALQAPQADRVNYGCYGDFQPWGRPAAGELLYTIIDFKLRSQTKAWADVRQFRSGRWFRETRFYQFAPGLGRWLRAELDPLFWQGAEEQRETEHFTVTYAVEDRELIPAMVNQLEADYAVLCRDLGCTSTGREMTFTLKMDAHADDFYFTIGESSELRFPSPRGMGLFESGRAYDWSNSCGHGTLARLMARRVAYGEADLERPGQLILDAGATWAIEHTDSLPESARSIIGALNQRPLLLLDELWERPADAQFEQAYAQAYMLMRFVEREYGAPAIARLMAAIGPAQSFSEAVEKGLGIPFAEFDLDWQIWTKKILTPLT
jgi:hypothetical protein